MLFGAGQAGETSSSGKLEEVGFNASGLPVVDKQITVNSLIARAGHLPIPFQEMTLLNKLNEMTNINIVFEEIPTAQVREKVNLMFASREFPDVFFDAGVSDRNLWEAAQGGDVYPLNDLIDEYSPNWKRAFVERPTLKREITFPDGNVYSLPYTRDIENDYLIRDIQAFNVDWMNQLGLEMPTTTEEFYQVLKAFRGAIDDGRLPKNGIPWYFRFHQWVGGEFEAYGAHGIWIKNSSYLSVNNGKVEFGAVDPTLLNALDFLHKLYAEDLIAEEAFTDDWNTYLSKIRSDPPITGLHGTYFIPENFEEAYDPLPPYKAPGVAKQLFRSQPIRVEKNQFTIMKKFEYPEAMVRWIDYTADDLWSIQLSYGPIGVTIDDNGDGTYLAHGVSAEYLQHSPHNFIPAYISNRIAEKITWTRDQGRRGDYATGIYKPFVWPQDRHYPRVMYTDSEQDEIAILETEVRSYVKSTLADWIVNGGARDGWDDYLKQLDKLGLEKLMGIYQTALDRFNS